MASVFRPSYTRPIPADADIVTRKGKRFARIKGPDGRMVLAPLTNDGKRCRLKARKWHIRFRDAAGVVRQVAGFSDREATRQRAAQLEREAELGRAGVVDPFKEHRKRPLAEHLADYRQSLRDKGNTGKYAEEVFGKVTRIADGCKFVYLGDVSASRVEAFLADLRRIDGLSIQTSNHHLKAIKQFFRWLVKNRRTGDDPLTHLATLNVATDRRHDRRALTDQEFTLLIESALSGPPVEAIPGPDRATMYVLSSWTGFRKGEVGSLTKRSFRLTDDPPTVTVEAAYSKRRRLDCQELHSMVVEWVRQWLETKDDLCDDNLLFPVSGKVPGGRERKTSKMMRKDLERARAAWIAAAETDAEQERRHASNFLTYQNDEGLFADYHATRHRFITHLSRAGVSPKMAQELARHSDIRLTMQRYTHIEVRDRVSAIESLPAPPQYAPGSSVDSIEEATRLTATGTDGQPLAPGLALTDDSCCPPMATDDAKGIRGDGQEGSHNPLKTSSFGNQCQPLAMAGEVHPQGFEPRTFGSVDRCSIQLSYGCKLG